MGTWILRFILLIICSTSGYHLVNVLFPDLQIGWLGASGGLLLVLLTLLVEKALKPIPSRSLLGIFAGLLVGEAVAYLLSRFMLLSLLNREQIALPLCALLYGVFGYIGIRIGLKKGEEMQLPQWGFLPKSYPRRDSAKILDTSVIIDGRIADIAETGFVEGPILIPQFVLRELQHIADSPDSIKRTRGKRGLEILHRLQKTSGLDVRIVDQDYPPFRDVDTKLIELAKDVGGKIITNDSNLNKVAELQGIDVLNINELANSLKPVVLPGEEMSVKILKEGKEVGQGVAYLDDGTMIVVDNGRRNIGKTVEVTVTSVLQTPAGRMIFARLKEDLAKNGKSRESYYSMNSDL